MCEDEDEDEDEDGLFACLYVLFVGVFVLNNEKGEGARFVDSGSQLQYPTRYG